jgi:hypothetical protein
MRATVAVLLFALPVNLPTPLTRLPQEARTALAAVRTSPSDKGFLIPDALPASDVARGDFDGDRHEDWAIIVADAKRTAVFVAYRSADEWRAGSVDVWGGPECQYCSHGSRLVAITSLPPGRYERPPHDQRLIVNERWRISSNYPGVLVTLADGKQRAYYLQHAWVFVALG